jgi:hypothetical protein
MSKFTADQSAILNEGIAILRSDRQPWIYSQGDLKNYILAIHPNQRKDIEDAFAALWKCIEPLYYQDRPFGREQFAAFIENVLIEDGYVKPEDHSMRDLLFKWWDFMDTDCTANRNEYSEQEQNELFDRFKLTLNT